jgi:hypothetical protein
MAWLNRELAQWEHDKAALRGGFCFFQGVLIDC